jgi:hypothetical protein
MHLAARRSAEQQGWEPIFDDLELLYRQMIARAAPVPNSLAVSRLEHHTGAKQQAGAS